MKTISTIIAIFAATAATAAFARDAVANADNPSTAEGRYFSEVYGAHPEDRLGIALPAALPADAVVKLLLPAGEPTRPTIVGAKAWPGEADRYVAIVCLGGNPDLVSQKICSTQNAPLRVYLGVIIAASGSAPRLVASAGPVDTVVPELPSGFLTSLPKNEASGQPMQQFGLFDFAHYQISPGQIAFGLRGGWETDGADLVLYHSGLLLFVVDGNRLKRILAVPMLGYYEFSLIQDDGSRTPRTLVDQTNLLQITQKQSAGHFDLRLKSPNGEELLFRWSEALGRYQPAR